MKRALAQGAAGAEYAPWLRITFAAFTVLALLILLSAPAARGAAPVSGDRLWVNWLDGPDHTLDGIVDVAEAPNGSLYAAGVTNDDWANAITLCGTKSLFVGGVIGTATHTDAAGTAKYLR